MKIDFNKTLMTLAGDPIRDGSMEMTMLSEAAKLAKGRSVANVTDAAEVLDVEKMTFAALVEAQGEAFALKTCLANLLVGRRAQSEKELDGKEVMRRFSLADKLWKAKEPISIKVEDVVLLKELLKLAYNERIYPALIIGQALQALEEVDDESKEAAPKIP